jgi:two-component system response regulator AtoC
MTVGATFLGSSPAAERIRQQIESAAGYPEPVLIVGETGTGKEVVARALHEAGPRRGRPFRAINCAGMATELLLSELFGHRAGAFTGASRRRLGAFRAAAASTLLLDEITEAPAGLQAALLRVLETNCVQPLGSDETGTVDVRAVATTNRSWAELQEGDCLRADLLHRLAGFIIDLPPLRRRAEDIRPLAGKFLAELGESRGTRFRLTAQAMAYVEELPLPGNGRELRQIILRASSIAADGRLGHEAVSAATTALPAAAGATDDEPTGDSLAAVIRSHIQSTLRATGGNLSAAARRLEVPRSTLQHYLVKYEVRRRARSSRSA